MLGGESRGAWQEPGRTSVVPAGHPAPGRAAVSLPSDCANARSVSSARSSSAPRAAHRAARAAADRVNSSGIDSALPEGRRLDAERSEIDVALTAMMDLVVADVEEKIPDRHLPLAERGVDFLEAALRDRRPELVDLRGGVVPLLQELRLR